jgi:hypothetical protein
VNAAFGSVTITTNASASNPWPTNLGCNGSTITGAVNNVVVTMFWPALALTFHYSADALGTPAMFTPVVTNAGGGSVNAAFGTGSGTLLSDLGTSLTIGGTLVFDGASIVGSC